jgi:hypothetical protein
MLGILSLGNRNVVGEIGPQQKDAQRQGERIKPSVNAADLILIRRENRPSVKGGLPAGERTPIRRGNRPSRLGHAGVECLQDTREKLDCSRVSL